MRRDILCVVAVSGLPVAAIAQCNRPVGPDLTISNIGAVVNYAADGVRDAFSVGADQTNVGNATINYFATTNAHPVTGQGLFRLRSVNGAMRFEQVGQSWLFHGIFPLQNPAPCGSCQGGDPTHLGIGCTSNDTASRTGSQLGLGPRWQVNPKTGAFPFPLTQTPFTGTVARRLQARLEELDLKSSYFVEVTSIAADDAGAGNGNNNVTYRPCTLSGGPGDFTMALSESAIAESAAISAWKAVDPAVVQTAAPVPGDGWFIASSRATPVGGMWRYEYAVYNLNADGGAGAFTVPLPDFAALTNVGFHDVDYTDGDGVNGVTRDGADWRATRGAGAITWDTTPYSVNPNANALLWGTLYNFRFDTNVPPRTGLVTLGTWKQAGSIAMPLQVPSSTCYANCDSSTLAPVLNVNDFICFQTRYAAGDSWANCDSSTLPPVLNVNDFVCFMGRYAAGCS